MEELDKIVEELEKNKIDTYLSVNVELNKILDFVRSGEDCKIAVNGKDEDFEANVVPLNASGYDNEICSQEISFSDYEDIFRAYGGENDYIEWLKNSYSEPIEIIKYPALIDSERYVIKFNFI